MNSCDAAFAAAAFKFFRSVPFVAPFVAGAESFVAVGAIFSDRLFFFFKFKCGMEVWLRMSYPIPPPPR